MNEEKRTECEIVVEGRFVKWFDNFWYHYKWPTIGIAVALVILIICIVQSCTKENKDIMIVYAGPNSLSISEQEQLGDLTALLLPSDLDGNGEIVAHWNTYQIYSEDEIREIESKKDANGKPITVDRNRITSEYQAYYNYMQTGESSVCFLAPWLYEKMLESGAVRPLSEVCSETPQGAIDDFGVRLGDTELYQTYDLLKVLPEDTVICLMRSHFFGRSSKEDLYQFETDTFCSMVEFSKEEE